MKKSTAKKKKTGIHNLLCVVAATSLIIGLITFPLAKERGTNDSTELETIAETSGFTDEIMTESEEKAEMDSNSAIEENAEMDSNSAIEENAVMSSDEWARDSATLFYPGISVFWIEDGIQVENPRHTNISSITATLYGRAAETDEWQVASFNGTNPIAISNMEFDGLESGTDWWGIFLNVPMSLYLKLEVTEIEGYKITYNGADSNLLSPGGNVSEIHVRYTYVGNEETESETETETETEGAVLVSIEVATPPDKIVYTEGDTFDPTGMVVTATYSDGSTQEITDSCIYFPNNVLATSNTTILISYSEDGITETTTQIITVKTEEPEESESETETEIETETETETET